MSQNKKIIVSKFGGTSMGDAACMLRSADVCIKQRSSVVVVSATAGTTNQLIELGKVAQSGDWTSAEGLIEKIKLRHLAIASELKANGEILFPYFSELDSLAKGIFFLRDCSPRALDALVSLGERMSSLLFHQALKSKSGQSVRWLDVRDIMVTDDYFGRARPQIPQIHKKSESIADEIRHHDVVYVTQGFIGRTEEGLTTTLGRGGSDYSAALIAEAVSADELEIWTDVPGIATTDPRIVAKAQSIKEISFKEASELAVFGAKVLHPATLLPAMRRNIPTFVGSSFESGAQGTWIKKRS